MNLSDIIELLYPEADMLIDVSLQDDGDGVIYIKKWNEEKLGAKPSEAFLLDQANSLSLMYLKKSAERRIRELVESKPSERGYDSIATLCSYTTSTNLGWKAEADAFISWRDSLFAMAYQTFYDIENGNIESPAVEDFIQSLPQLIWPS